MLRQGRTPEYLLQDPYEMELQRIILNIQISLVHSIGKQIAECTEKMGQAEAEFMSRLQRGQIRPGSVGMWLHHFTFDEVITNGGTT